MENTTATIALRDGRFVTTPATVLLFSIPGWKEGLEVYVHRTIGGGRNSWTVSERRTTLRLSPDGCGTRKDAIARTLERLQRRGEASVRFALDTSPTPIFPDHT